jgi:hypothetical protein
MFIYNYEYSFIHDDFFISLTIVFCKVIQGNRGIQDKSARHRECNRLYQDWPEILKPIKPTTISRNDKIRIMDVESLNARIPIRKVPAVPMPVQTA